MDRTTYSQPDRSRTFGETSTVTVGFHRLKREGKVPLPIKPYMWVHKTMTHPVSPTYLGMSNINTFSHNWGLRDSTTNGYIQVPGSIANRRLYIDGQASMESIVGTRLAARARDTEIDLGVALGEYRETAHFITTAVKRITQSALELRRGDIIASIKRLQGNLYGADLARIISASAALRALTGRRNDRWVDVPNIAADMWLSWKFALRPILTDIEGAMNVLRENEFGYVPVRILRTRFVRPLDYELDNFPSLGRPSDVVRTVMYGEHRCSGYMEIMVANPLLHAFDQVGILNPLAVAWELVPFSFVLDWITNIGDAILNIVPPQGIDIIRGYTYYKAHGHVDFLWRNTNPSRLANVMGQAEELIKHRKVLTSFPVVRLTRPDLSGIKDRLATALALLWAVGIGGSIVPQRG